MLIRSDFHIATSILKVLNLNILQGGKESKPEWAEEAGALLRFSKAFWPNGE